LLSVIKPCSHVKQHFVAVIYTELIRLFLLQITSMYLALPHGDSVLFSGFSELKFYHKTCLSVSVIFCAIRQKISFWTTKDFLKMHHTNLINFEGN